MRSRSQFIYEHERLNQFEEELRLLTRERNSGRRIKDLRSLGASVYIQESNKEDF